MYKLWGFRVRIRHLGDSQANWGRKIEQFYTIYINSKKFLLPTTMIKEAKLMVCGRETVLIVPADTNRNDPKETLGPVESQCYTVVWDPTFHRQQSISCSLYLNLPPVGGTPGVASESMVQLLFPMNCFSYQELLPDKGGRAPYGQQKYQNTGNYSNISDRSGITGCGTIYFFNLACKQDYKNTP